MDSAFGFNFFELNDTTQTASPRWTTRPLPLELLSAELNGR